MVITKPLGAKATVHVLNFDEGKPIGGSVVLPWVEVLHKSGTIDEAPLVA